LYVEIQIVNLREQNPSVLQRPSSWSYLEKSSMLIVRVMCIMSTYIYILWANCGFECLLYSNICTNN